MKHLQHQFRFYQSLMVLIVIALSGCSDSKSSSPPARTFGAPATRVKDAEQYSAPHGCNGNPYYYNYKTEKWVYFDDSGSERESPVQPPCPGMRVKKVKSGSAERGPGGNPG